MGSTLIQGLGLQPNPTGFEGHYGNSSNSTLHNYMSSVFNMKNFDWKGAVASGYGMLYNNIPTPHSDLNSSNQDSANLRSGISLGLLSAGLQSGNPYLAAAGVAYGVVDKTGGFNDASMSLDSTSNTINKIGSIALPGAGWFLSSTKKYKKSKATEAMLSGYQGFNDFADKVQQDSGGKFLVGSSKINDNVNKASVMDASILDIKANRDNDFTSMYSMTLSIGIGNQYALNGGFNSQYAVAAKKGSKLETLNWAKSLKIGGDLEFSKFTRILPNFKYTKYFGDDALKVELLNKENNKEDISEPEISIEEPKIEISRPQPKEIDIETLNFLKTLELDADGNYLVSEDLYNEIMSDETKKRHLKELDINIKLKEDQSPSNVNVRDPRRIVSNKLGGTFNVIPDGALHKNKHHMEDAEGLTKKGIPVVTEEDGELIQQAEIERDEIILHLSLTEKLESMLKDCESAKNQSEKDNIAVNAGKLLVRELLHNTVDNTGLLKS